MHFDYYYGAQSENFVFFRIPRVLVTEPILREFIDKIVVHRRKHLYGEIVQKVEIHYKMIGYVELPHMSKASEQAYMTAFGRKETD